MKKIIILFTVFVCIFANAQEQRLRAPKWLSYPSPNLFTVGVQITPKYPTVYGGSVAAYSVSPSLPQGLTINTSTGKISGTPTQATPLATYTVTASNNAGSTSFGVKITVNAPAGVPPPSALSYTSPNTFIVGSAIAQLNPTITGNVSSYSVSPILPAGLTINSTSGKITGTPTAVTAQTTYTVTASNSSGSTTFGVVIKVNAAPVVLPAPSSLSYTSPNTFIVGTAISTLSPTVSGDAVASYTVSPSLPAGLAINSATGKITGTPTAVTAQATFTVTASNATGSTTFGVVIKVNAAPVVLPAPSSLSYTSPNTFVVGTAISTLNPTVSGGAVASYTVSPSLPAGLAINSTTGKITGTPTAVTAQATFTVTASNATGSTTFGVVIKVNAAPVVLPAPSSLSYTSPNTFVVGTAISTLSPTVSGGAVASYTVSPSLPAGLAINSTTGKITGTPTAVTAQATFTVTASNATGSTTFGVVIKVNAAPVVLPAPSALSYNSPNTFIVGTSISALNPTISGGAVASYTVSPSLPAGLTINATTGNITGTPTANMGSSTYTVTATNATGSTTFGVVITVNAAAPAPGVTSSVTYTSSTASIANPERGFYKHTETHSTGYSALNQSTLTGYRTASNINLILRVFYLENFVSTNISSTYLTSMQADFVKIRAAGLKSIVRFAYSDDNDNGQPQDATKAQILAHINQLAPILQANSDVIAVMQIGFIGAWGEWYYTTNFGMNPTTTDYANRKEVVNALLAALPAGKMVQMRTPSLKQNTYNVTTPLSLTQAYTSTSVARVGHHNDCFLASSDDYGTYNNPATEYPYLEQETKYVPMGGETCALNAPRSQCTTAISEMAKFHWSYMNLDYNENVIAGFQTGNCFNEMQNRMGYRFELVDGTYPVSSVVGSTMPVTMKIKNSGFATPYNARTPYIVLRNTATSIEYKVAMNSNPRFWNAGTTLTISDNIALPSNMVPGTYNMFLALPDSDTALSTRPEYSIRLANNSIWESSTGYNNLQHTVTVTNGSSRLVDAKQPGLQLTLYPVPADNTLNVEMEKISDYNIAVFNSLGQRMSVPTSTEGPNKITLDMQSLTNGIYFVSFTNGETTETKRIIVSH